MHNFTSNDLLLYVLEEAEPSVRMAIEDAMVSSTQIMNEVLSMKLSLHDIQSYSVEPSPGCIQAILTELHQENIQAV
ncbi:MAG: hypothetical protein JNJ58_09915 [Chitinophagaceae bacterium]|nr:hypothetical protein [Chitinophagaceae bacterium]